MYVTMHVLVCILQ